MNITDEELTLRREREAFVFKKNEDGFYQLGNELMAITDEGMEPKKIHVFSKPGYFEILDPFYYDCRNST